MHVHKSLIELASCLGGQRSGAGLELTIIWKSRRCILSKICPLVFHYCRETDSVISSEVRSKSVQCSAQVVKSWKIFFCYLYRPVLWQFHWIVSPNAWSLVYYSSKVRVIDFQNVEWFSWYLCMRGRNEWAHASNGGRAGWGRMQGFGSVSGSAWIRINLSCWIRIRIQIADPKPWTDGSSCGIACYRSDTELTI